MSFHRNHKVNNLILTVINDGNGDQCGVNYNERMKHAEFPLGTMQKAVKHYNDSLPSNEKANRRELFAARNFLGCYYREHFYEANPERIAYNGISPSERKQYFCYDSPLID